MNQENQIREEKQLEKINKLIEKFEQNIIYIFKFLFDTF